MVRTIIRHERHKITYQVNTYGTVPYGTILCEGVVTTYGTLQYDAYGALRYGTITGEFIWNLANDRATEGKLYLINKHLIFSSSGSKEYSFSKE